MLDKIASLDWERFGHTLAGNGMAFDLARAKEEELKREAEEKRRKAFLEDSAVALMHLKRGRPERAKELMANRQQILGQIGGDPRHTNEIIRMLDSGDYGALQNELQTIVDVGVARGMIQPLERPDEFLETKDGMAYYRGADGVYAKAIDGYSAPEPSQKDALDMAYKQEQIAKMREEREGMAAERARLAKNSQGMSDDEREIYRAEQKEAVKKNTDRIAELSKGVDTRDASVRKARRFLRAIESGERDSGFTRTAAGFIPGVWTKQGQFDEEFDSFAEVAAREKLKAVGEIRPTDADVEGMKRAMFSPGRDEQTNITLLTEFINEMESLDDELESLVLARREGRLGEFAYTSPAINYKLADGRTVSREDLEYTAEKNGISIDEVIKQSGAREIGG